MLLMTFLTCTNLAQQFHVCLFAVGEVSSWSLVLSVHFKIKDIGTSECMALIAGIRVALASSQGIWIQVSLRVSFVPSDFWGCLLAPMILSRFPRSDRRVMRDNDTILCNYKRTHI